MQPVLEPQRQESPEQGHEESGNADGEDHREGRLGKGTVRRRKGGDFSF
jgi:hypothetical protein